MNNNEIEIVDRAYENVANKKEKKLQFYSKTYAAIQSKYKSWRNNRLNNKMEDKKEKIDKAKNIIASGRLNSHDEGKIKRKMEKLQDQVEYIDLALNDEKYLHLNVRLLKVAERAGRSISRWWKDFTNRKEKSVVEENEVKNENELNVDNPEISTESIENMINNEFNNIDSQEISNESIENMVNDELQAVKPSMDSDSTYRLGREELRKMGNSIDRIDESKKMEKQELRVINNEFAPPAIVDSTPKVPSVYESNKGEFAVLNNDNKKDYNTVSRSEDNSQENSFGIPDEMAVVDKHFDNMKELSGVYNNTLPMESATIDSILNTSLNSIDTDKETIESLEQYRKILKSQADRKQQMEMQRKRAMEEYEMAQEKNNEVIDRNSYLKEAIASRLDIMQKELDEKSQKTEQELEMMRNKTQKLNSNTTRLVHSNESLRAMCDELNIGVDVESNTKGKTK